VTSKGEVHGKVAGVNIQLEQGKEKDPVSSTGMVVKGSFLMQGGLRKTTPKNQFQQGPKHLR